MYKVLVNNVTYSWSYDGGTGGDGGAGGDGGTGGDGGGKASGKFHHTQTNGPDGGQSLVLTFPFSGFLAMATKIFLIFSSYTHIRKNYSYLYCSLFNIILSCFNLFS